MPVGSWLGILFPMPQQGSNFGRDNKILDLVKKTHFDTVMLFLVILHLEEIKWAAAGCLEWFYYE